MAQDHAGPQTMAPWKKIFTGFKLALDLKKLLLAAAGILLTCLGWQILGWVFHDFRSVPEWKNVDTKEPADKKASWIDFKARRASWNLLHELAGSPSDVRRIDAADVTGDLDEFLLLNEWDEAYQRLSEPITIKDKNPDKKEYSLEVTKNTNLKFTVKPLAIDDDKAMPRLKEKSDKNLLTLQAIEFKDKNEQTAKVIDVDGVAMTVLDGPFEDLKKYREGAMDFQQLQADAAKRGTPLAQKALLTFKSHLLKPRPKTSGKLRTWPWFEYRGENPYLLLTGHLKAGSESAIAQPSWINWLFYEEVPVLLEPIVKFLTPVAYLFDARARWWDRLYLVLGILWTLAVWGFFGGAICRIAAVQIARNERITLKESVLFAKDRFLSYFIAPVFPLAGVAFLIFCLMIFGWLEWTPYIGDLFAGIFWPVVLLVGFIMAVVLVGLVGWPMMNATISTEGSDSFDAISRSYSYVYQAPWHYLWYTLVAVVYGAALVFFVGFMASLMVFLGKWSVGSAPGLASSKPDTDREPSYLFYYAPTSFGWRDLLISDSRFVEEKFAPATVSTQKWPSFMGDGPYAEFRNDAPSSQLVSLQFKPEYVEKLGTFNRIGAFLVAIWIYLLFLLVVGFGYSYFWSASTLIYFLMRRHVDDTDMDEVHMEDEGLDDPFLKPATPAPPAPAAPPAASTPSKPGTLSLNVIEGPPPAPLAPPPAPLAPPPPAAPPSVFVAPPPPAIHEPPPPAIHEPPPPAKSIEDGLPPTTPD